MGSCARQVGLLRGRGGRGGGVGDGGGEHHGGARRVRRRHDRVGSGGRDRGEVERHGGGALDEIDEELEGLESLVGVLVHGEHDERFEAELVDELVHRLVAQFGQHLAHHSHQLCGDEAEVRLVVVNQVEYDLGFQRLRLDLWCLLLLRLRCDGGRRVGIFVAPCVFED